MTDNFFDYEEMRKNNEIINTIGNTAALETLLAYSMSAADAKNYAGKLLNACGSLSAVFDAPYSILLETGLNMSQAVLIKLIPAVTRRYLDDKFFSSSNNAYFTDFKSKVIAAFIGLNKEQVLLSLKDKNDTELYFGMISKGSVNSSEIYIKDMMELAMRNKAATVVIAHNHPSGIAYPSKRDIDSTMRIKFALETINVRLSDHYIIAGNNAFSMAKSEEFFDIFL